MVNKRSEEVEVEYVAHRRARAKRTWGAAEITATIVVGLVGAAVAAQPLIGSWLEGDTAGMIAVGWVMFLAPAVAVLLGTALSIALRRVLPLVIGAVVAVLLWAGYFALFAMSGLS